MTKEESIVTLEPEEVYESSYSWVAALIVIAFLFVLFFSFGGYTLLVP